MRKLLKKIKKYCRPTKKFLKESKVLFIKQLHEQGIVTKNQSIRILLYRAKFNYILAVLLAIAVFSGGTAAFAEIQNVSATHPLYKIKRLGETVQIKVAPQNVKSQMHNKFAQRRLDEIKQIKSEIKEPSNNDIVTIDNLNQDFTAEIKETINEIEVPQNNATSADEQESEKEKKMEENLKNTCQSISQKIEEYKKILPQGQENEDWHEFEGKCGSNEKNYESQKTENKKQEEKIKVRDEEQDY
ncbi:MAG: hypothetical protein PHE77_03690 [Candidatus Pacebacteria bacterium]|nr:hypothetical protein [Candidatus Paceibacterota bacterium]